MLFGLIVGAFGTHAKPMTGNALVHLNDCMNVAGYSGEGIFIPPGDDWFARVWDSLADKDKTQADRDIFSDRVRNVAPNLAELSSLPAKRGVLTQFSNDLKGALISHLGRDEVAEIDVQISPVQQSLLVDDTGSQSLMTLHKVNYEEAPSSIFNEIAEELTRSNRLSVSDEQEQVLVLSIGGHLLAKFQTMTPEHFVPLPPHGRQLEGVTLRDQVQIFYSESPFLGGGTLPFSWRLSNLDVLTLAHSQSTEGKYYRNINMLANSLLLHLGRTKQGIDIEASFLAR